VTEISPASGPVTGGTSVTITGGDFVSGATVTIGGNPLTNVTVVSPSQLAGTTPAGTVGAKDVVVTTSTGTGTCTACFTYQGPVALYLLEGNALDASGNGNNGTTTGTLSAATGHTGQASTALSFSGNSYITVPSNALLKGLTADLTVVFWVKKGATDITSTMIPVSRRVTDDKIHFLLYGQPGGFGFMCCNPAGGTTTGMFYMPSGSGLTTINDGQWHQVAATRRFGASGFTQLFLDGVLVSGTYTAGSATADALVVDADLMIGRQASASPGQFAGNLDNVYIFNRILTQGEIQALP
jgi:hypothetical protein